LQLIKTERDTKNSADGGPRIKGTVVEAKAGFEPAYPALQAGALPLCYLANSNFSQLYQSGIDQNLLSVVRPGQLLPSPALEHIE
jgi:hypothetical protein